MNSVEELKTIAINTQKGICIVNGVDVSRDASYLKLVFENGEWSLQITTKRTLASAYKESGIQATTENIFASAYKKIGIQQGRIVLPNSK